MLPTHKPTLRVVAGVIRNDRGEVLVAQCADGHHHGRLWEFPGGKVERGETDTDALKRELMEELGIRVTVDERLTVVRSEQATRWIALHAYLCRITSGIPTLHVHTALRWVPPLRLDTVAWAPADAEVAASYTDRNPVHPVEKE